MGIFRTPKYRKSAAEIAMEEQMEQDRIDAEKEKERLIAEEKRYKKRFGKGMIGVRSLFTKAGGSGFFSDGEQT
jgi:hypothetical protein